MNQPSDKRAATLLVVEDDEVDLLAIERGFRQHKIANDVVTAKDGLDALQILRGGPDRPPLPKPYLILLDLNMPRMNGFELLTALRQDPELQSSVVFVLTTSKSDEDRARAYASHVAGFIVKADAGRSFLDAIELVDHYWKIVELP
jgi:CheY-like chemotaxis protein